MYPVRDKSLNGIYGRDEILKFDNVADPAMAGDEVGWLSHLLLFLQKLYERSDAKARGAERH